MPTFASANGRLHHYRLRQGAGVRSVVFVNSLGTDMRIWDDVIRLLPDDLSVLTYDMAGHGLSEHGAETVEDFASDLAALMDSLDLKAALVCGVSFGGMIAQELAAARRDLVAGLVLCNTAHRIGTAEIWADRIAALDAGGLEPMADGIMERWFSPGFRHNAALATAGYRIMLTRTPVLGYRTVCAAIRDADLTNVARGLDCPMLCVAGEDDLATPVETVSSLAALIPRARLTIYDTVGHLPCIEAPDRLAADIVDQLWRLT